MSSCTSKAIKARAAELELKVSDKKADARVPSGTVLWHTPSGEHPPKERKREARNEGGTK